MRHFSTLLKQLILSFVFFASATSARNVKFSIVSFGKSVKVEVGDKSYSLTKYDNDTPLFQSTIEVSDNDISYNYVVDDIPEDFTRTLVKGETTTHNEFYNRKYTIKKIPQLPTIYEWTKSIGKGELFDDSYIPTVHITGATSEKIFTTVDPDTDYAEKVVFILKDSVYTFEKVKCNPKNIIWNKFQFKIKLPNKNGIEGRYLLKFRDNNEDPTFMRQDLYGDILNALGYPTIQSVKTRVYVNGRAVGYYILQEEAASESFARATFHGDGNGKLLITETSKLGHSFDCSTGADFYYTGNDFYSFKVTNDDRYDRTRVKALAKAFEELDVTDSKAVEKFDKEWFDIDSFFKAIAMEYLTAHWDSYWFYSTNFALYQDPTQSTDNTFKFYFICQDWDGTFGLNAGKTYMRFDDYINHSYKDYVNVKWGIDEYDSPQRYAIDKLLSEPTLRTRFENILKTIVTKVFNPVVIGKRLDALVERHREEVAWNYDTCSLHPLRIGTSTSKWTINDFENNLTKSVGRGASYGIKQFIYLRVKAVKEEFGLDIDLGDSSNTESNDGRCGKDKGRCPNNQCCSQYGYCGTTTDHCNTGCQSEFGKCNSNGTTTTVTKTTTIKTTTTTKITTSQTSTTLISTDGRCGQDKGRCPNNQCCSRYGYCGTDDTYCNAGCQPEFGKCNSTTNTAVVTTTTVSTSTPTQASSGRCGADFGKTCPNGQCCSKYGYCGTSEKHCGTGCQTDFGKCNIGDTVQTATIDTDPITVTITTTATSIDSTTGKCGADFGNCPDGQCCSKYGYCGDTDSYCGSGCQPAFGICN